MKKILAMIGLMVLAGEAWAQSTSQPMLSIPGIADAAAQAIKESKAIGAFNFDNKYAAGIMTPVRTIHDGQGIKYAAFGPGGIIRQGDHLRGGPVALFDISAIVRNAEGRNAWYQNHVDKITLPDFWLGYSCLPPLDDSFTWKSYKSWNGVSIAMGF